MILRFKIDIGRNEKTINRRVEERLIIDRNTVYFCLDFKNVLMTKLIDIFFFFWSLYSRADGKKLCFWRKYICEKGSHLQEPINIKITRSDDLPTGHFIFWASFILYFKITIYTWLSYFILTHAWLAKHKIRPMSCGVHKKNCVAL